MNREPQNSGLRLDDVVDGLGATEEEEARRQWNVSDRVTTHLRMEIGCPAPAEPDFDYPRLNPNNLTTPSSKAYTDEYAKRTAWLGYLGERLAEHQAKLLEIKAEMGDIERRIRTSERKHNASVTAKGKVKLPSLQAMSDKIGENPRYKDLQQEQLFEEEVILRLGAKVYGASEEQKLYSRNVEIRRQDFDQSNRNNNIRGNRGIPVSGGQGRRG